MWSVRGCGSNDDWVSGASWSRGESSVFNKPIEKCSAGHSAESDADHQQRVDEVEQGSRQRSGLHEAERGYEREES